VPPPAATTVVVPAQTADVTPFGACLEERLGPEAARALVSGEREETPEEEAVLEDCLLAAASGVSAEAITPAVAACLEARLGAGALQAVGSGARELTAQEESVLADCLLASTLGAPLAVTACLGDRIGAEAVRLILSGDRDITEEEEAVLADCLLASALVAPTEPASAAVSKCVEQRVGAEAARAIVSASRQLTADEQTVLGDCVLASAFGVATGTVSPPVAACLEERLGTEASQAIASGSRNLTADEQAVRGDCVLASALAPAEDTTISPAVAACLEKRLGAEAAQAAASGSRELTAQESSALGGCLLEAALGANP
jgi:hypothetical protein